MDDVLKILLVEDNIDDAEIIKRHLAKAGMKFSYKLIETRKDFMNALNEFKPDLIISDYNLPTFNGMQALMMRKDMAPMVPFILVTGSLNEDIAVEVMKAGADDYVIKQNFTRLVPAINAAIEKQNTIRQKAETEQALIERERIFRNLYSNMNEGVCLFKLVYNKDKLAVNYRIASVNRQFERIINIPESNLIGRLSTDVENNPIPFNVKEYKRVANEETNMLFETVYTPLNKHLLISISPWEPDGFAAIITDITAIRKAEEFLRRSD